MDLSRRSWVDVEARAPAVTLVPVGSVEQHGPHAPLGTDLLVADAVAERAHRTAADVVRTPAVPIGVAAEHRHFAGSLWVEPDTFRAYVGEVARSLIAHDVAVVVFVNGHGGNVAALEEVAAGLTRAEPARVAAFTWFEALADPPAPMGHGGLLETAAVMAVAPDLVDEARLDAAAAGASERWGRWVRSTNLAVDVDTFSENGVVGDPREATAQIGEALLEEAVGALETVIAELRTLADEGR